MISTKFYYCEKYGEMISDNTEIECEDCTECYQRRCDQEYEKQHAEEDNVPI
jgi:hypothetical protein